MKTKHGQSGQRGQAGVLVGMRGFVLAMAAAFSLSACGESVLELIGFNESNVPEMTADAGGEVISIEGQMCEPGLCGVRGTCDDSSGNAICTCDPGYRGAKCAFCATGYAEDEDGECVPVGQGWNSADENDAGTSGGQDASVPTPSHDAGTGTPDAGPVTQTCASMNISCGAHGTCRDGAGSPYCECDAGYSGNECQRCASGYTPSGSSCIATCQTANLSCGSHGHCSDDSGTAHCVCNTGYTGANCTSCASGYQDNDGDGVCKASCSASSLSCGSHGSCSDASGTAKCACNTGYTGTTCAACASGYQDNDSDGTCKPKCSNAGLSCSGHSSCSDTSGTATCVCETGYSGSSCSSCASGYQDNDRDGTCKPNCATASLSCSSGQVCQDSSGTATCISDGTTTVPNDEWTFMVFLDGDNNLKSNADKDLKEIENGLKAAKSSDKVNVIVLYDGDGASDTKLYKVTHTGKTTLNSGTSIFSGSEANMNSADTLKKFGVWAVKNYPAKKYALVMWDHGGGWRDGGDADDENACRCTGAFGILSGRTEPEPAMRDFSTDDNAGSGSITLADGDYGTALNAIKAQAGQKLSIVGFDACLMGMYEVAAASASYADYLVASSEVEPGGGWDYEPVLKLLGKTPTTSALDLGKKIVDAYYSASSYDATLAVFDLSKFSAMQTALNTFGTQLKSALSTSSYKTAIRAVRNDSSLQHFDYAEHIDLRHFIQLLKAKSSSLPSSLISAATTADTAASNMVVYFKHQNKTSYYGYSHDNAHGMAIFFPASFTCTGWLIGSGASQYSCNSSDPCSPDPCSGDNEHTNWYRKSEATGAYKNTGWSSGWADFLKAYY